MVRVFAFISGVFFIIMVGLVLAGERTRALGYLFMSCLAMYGTFPPRTRSLEYRVLEGGNVLASFHNALDAEEFARSRRKHIPASQARVEQAFED